MIFFVVPAYNEEMNISRLIEETDKFLKKHELSYKLIIVDDGSRDRTASLVKDKAAHFPCELISYQPNQGVQEAFRRGLRHALETAGNSDAIITMEADLTGDLNLILKFLSKLSHCDVAVASYHTKGGGVIGTVWHRRVISWLANLYSRTLFHINGVNTYSSFYRIYKPEVLRKVILKYGDFFEEKGFSCVVELLLRIHRLGFRIDEVPMVLQGAQRSGKSKMKILQTMMGYFRIASRNVFKTI